MKKFLLYIYFYFCCAVASAIKKQTMRRFLELGFNIYSLLSTHLSTLLLIFIYTFFLFCFCFNENGRIFLKDFPEKQKRNFSILTCEHDLHLNWIQSREFFFIFSLIFVILIQRFHLWRIANSSLILYRFMQLHYIYFISFLTEFFFYFIILHLLSISPSNVTFCLPCDFFFFSFPFIISSEQTSGGCLK